MAMAPNMVSIRDFYKDRSVFITGATGFMGKVLVEKLLRSCPGIRHIYLLVRPKANRDVRMRLEELLNAKVFDRIKKEQPEVLNKLIPISGDITLAGLGIAPSDVKLLTDNVSVVFHSAATVKFDEVLKRSIEMNVQGTQRLVDLCHKMKDLLALVHVSTAYCNCDREEIGEMVYPMSVSPKQMIDAMEWMDEESVQAITPQLLGNRPNTYTYTKALAELVLLEDCGSLPVAIVRPSIVAAAWKEPIAGWVDNLNGPTGLILGCGKGVIRTILCNGKMVADLIPVDVPINMMITVAWYTATLRPNNIMVYNCTSGSVNRVSWGELKNSCHSSLLKNPLNDILWYPQGSFMSSKVLNTLAAYLMHDIPAYAADTLAYLTGRKQVFMKMQLKIKKALVCLEYFTTHEWKFDNTNMYMLLESMPKEEQHIFNFDMRTLHWPTYLEHYCLGTKVFVLKEDLSTLPAARKHLRKLYILRYLSRVMAFVLTWRLLMTRSKWARQLWYLLFSLVIRVSQMLPNFTWS